MKTYKLLKLNSPSKYGTVMESAYPVAEKIPVLTANSLTDQGTFQKSILSTMTNFREEDGWIVADTDYTLPEGWTFSTTVMPSKGHYKDGAKMVCPEVKIMSVTPSGPFSLVWPKTEGYGA